MNSEYKTSTQNINTGSFVGLYTITPSANANGASITDDQIQAELLAQINAGHLPAATLDNQGNAQTYYALFFPPGITISLGGYLSCSYFCAYHGTFAAAGSVKEFYYAVQPDMTPGSACNGGCGGGTVFENYCQVSSHELVEMITGKNICASLLLNIIINLKKNHRPRSWYQCACMV